MITDLWFYVTAIPALLIYGIGKGGLGGGVGVIAVPLMAMTTSPSIAAAVMLPILCVMDLFAIKHHAVNCDYRLLKTMLPAALIGIAIAGVFLKDISEYRLKILLGILCLLFCLQYWFFSVEVSKPSKYSGYFWSLLGGFSSTAIHAGGGPISIYLLPQRLSKVTLIGTMAVLFGIVNIFKLIPYTLLGEFSSVNLTTALVLMPIAPIGVKLGVWLLSRVNQNQIYQLCYFFLFLSGLKLLGDGLLIYT
ncbi:TSUP family transporter [Vibrio sp. 99-8-1]|uniref:TSUP family transporter n=1 Tax=Vibrio sp. 99-8-1 TaxID=2607602 RepID=UPI00149329A0|nr:sulfite exporter TauE/SafE family protein [Vibrio sp. 99-8-1]